MLKDLHSAWLGLPSLALFAHVFFPPSTVLICFCYNSSQWCKILYQPILCPMRNVLLLPFLLPQKISSI